MHLKCRTYLQKPGSLFYLPHYTTVLNHLSSSFRRMQIDGLRLSYTSLSSSVMNFVLISVNQIKTNIVFTGICTFPHHQLTPPNTYSSWFGSGWKSCGRHCRLYNCRTQTTPRTTRRSSRSRRNWPDCDNDCVAEPTKHTVGLRWRKTVLNHLIPSFRGLRWFKTA